MRKGMAVLACLVVVSVLVSVAQAHLCDDVWRQLDKLILKPEVTTLIVKDEITFKVFMQHNMDRTFDTTIRLLGESPAFHVTVAPEKGYAPPIRPGQRYDYTVTLKVKKGQSSGKYPLTFRLVGSGAAANREIKTLRMGALQELTGSEPASTPAGRKRFSVPNLKQGGPPTLDGRLEEPCWQRALQCGGFTSPGRRRARWRTQVLIGSLPQTLYLGLGCQWRAAEAQGLTDAVTIHLAHPDPESPRLTITVESGGKVTVKKGRAQEQQEIALAETGVQVAVFRTQAAWFAEVAVPAALLGTETFDTDSRWLVNFVRESQIEPAETTFWQGKPTDYLEPSAFAELRFSP